MLVSHTHGFAFVHVPKTGGCSISLALQPYCDHVMRYWMNRWLDRIGIHVNHLAPHRLKRYRLHTPAETLRRQVPAAAFSRLYKFAFVRNPWDLLVSYYNFVRSTPGHHRSARAVGLASFDRYVEYELRRDKISQSRMLCDRRGVLLVDDVGRFESIEADFARICRRLGIDATLPYVNRGVIRDRRDYRTYYSRRLADRVAEHFAEDIERFGYRFESVLHDAA